MESTVPFSRFIKKADITSIYQKDSRNDKERHQPVSISFISKIFEERQKRLSTCKHLMIYAQATKCEKRLSIKIDKELNFNEHVQSLCKKSGYLLCTFSKGDYHECVYYLSFSWVES